MPALIHFFRFSDPNVRYVVFGISLLMASSALLGTFALLQKRALVGDAISHAALPGLCAAFILSGDKNPLALVVGAFVAGWLALTVINTISKHPRVSQDTAIAVVLTSFFGLGMLLLTHIQQSGNAAQAGLNNFLLGKAISLVGKDVNTLTALSVLIIVVMVIFFKELSLVCFDKNFARAIGMPVGLVEFVLTSVSVLAIVVGIRAVGIVLMSAMLITPAAAARFWANKLRNIIFIAIAIGISSGVLGSFVSYVLPAMPTGPWVVIVATAIAYLSFIFAPKKGILARRFAKLRHQNKIVEENILKALYELGSNEGNTRKAQIVHAILQSKPMPMKKFLKFSKKLKSKNLLAQEGEWYALTDAGVEAGKKVLHLHTLWEFYLMVYLRIKPDHVHEDAEGIEHVLTPELAEELERLMKDHGGVGESFWSTKF